MMLTRRCSCGAVQKAIRCGSAVEVKVGKVDALIVSNSSLLRNCCCFSVTKSVTGYLPAVSISVLVFVMKGNVICVMSPLNKVSSFTQVSMSNISSA